MKKLLNKRSFLFGLASRTSWFRCVLSIAGCYFLVANWTKSAGGESANDLRVARSSAAVHEVSSRDVEVTLDLTQGLNIGGSRTLRREAYFNVHGTPSELTEHEAISLLGTLRANMGRSMGAISGLMGRLKEDPKRPGFADPQILEKCLESYLSHKSKRGNTHQEGLEIVHSVHPFSYYGKPEEKGQENSPFVPGSHEAAAEILSAFFSRIDVEREPYFEVANEGNVHVRGLGTTMEDLCDLHSELARRLHEEVPGLKIGGPASAWPAFEVKDFQVWRDQMGLFIDRAGKDMDFLSIHLYTTHYDDKVNNRFGANIDAILDLMENKALLSTGEVKPLLISECGTGLKKGERIMKRYSPQRDWLIMQGASHAFFDLLRRDDRLIKMIPFMVLKASWYDSEYPYPWTLYHRDKDEWKLTHLVKWYEFWKDVQGRHLPTSCSSLDVQTHALLDGRTVYLLLDNLLNSEVSLTVQELVDQGLNVESASISSLYYDGVEPVISPKEPLQQLGDEVVLEPHAAAIIRIGLSKIPQLRSELYESTFYGDRILQPIMAKPAYFMIEVPKRGESIKSCTLRLGIGRSKDLSLRPRVLINGHLIKVPGGARGNTDLVGDQTFATKEIKVPVEFLRKKNRLSVQFAEPGGRISSAVLVVREIIKPG